MLPIDQAKGDFIRKYIYELCFVALGMAVVFLFNRYEKINDYLRTEQAALQKEATRVIERNTVILEKIIKEDQ